MQQLKQDEARKALVSEIGVNCERVGEGHRWADLRFEERLAYGPLDASEMLGPVVVDGVVEE